MKRFLVTKEKAILFAFSLIFALLLSNNVFHVRDFLSSTAMYALYGIFGSILFYLLFQAGLIVIKSLLLVAAELSLIVFLAQSYCAAGVVRTATSDAALGALIVLGLSFVAYRFLADACKELGTLVGKFKEVNGKWNWELVLTAGFLALFVGLFVYMIYLVVSPITASLCIY